MAQIEQNVRQMGLNVAQVHSSESALLPKSARTDLNEIFSVTACRKSNWLLENGSVAEFCTKFANFLFAISPNFAQVHSPRS